MAGRGPERRGLLVPAAFATVQCAGGFARFSSLCRPFLASV